VTLASGTSKALAKLLASARAIVSAYSGDYSLS
jgi:hypothetical protein